MNDLKILVRYLCNKYRIRKRNCGRIPELSYAQIVINKKEVYQNKMDRKKQKF